MKKSRFTETQIIGILKAADAVLSPWWMKIIVDYENPLRVVEFTGGGGDGSSAL